VSTIIKKKKKGEKIPRKPKMGKGRTPGLGRHWDEREL